MPWAAAWARSLARWRSATRSLIPASIVPVGISFAAQVEKEQVILQVSDTGCGIPLEEQSKIFDRFYRASNVSAEVAGTGLGLAITKSVVENHRGRIWVDSKLGQGSMFTIVLPVFHEK